MTIARSKRSPTQLALIGLATLLLVAMACSSDGEPSESSAPAAVLLPGSQVAVADLEHAEGRVADWVEGQRSLNDTEIVTWVVVGDWVLDCTGPCVDADLGDVRFDMALAMVQPGGEASHSHQFNTFSAEEVEQKSSGPGGVVQADDLTFEGKINFSPVGLVDISMELVGVANGNATFFFTLGAGSPFRSRTGGVVTASR